jgi:23S rRNA maturation mini-RNase III
VQKHQHVKNGIREDDIKKVAYLTHESSPVFLDLVSQAFWDWIIKIAMIKGVAAANTFQSQPSSSEEAETLDSLVPVLRARGRKAARRGKNYRQGVLIKTNEKKRDIFHCRCP